MIDCERNIAKQGGSYLIALPAAWIKCFKREIIKISVKQGKTNSLIITPIFAPPNDFRWCEQIGTCDWEACKSCDHYLKEKGGCKIDAYDDLTNFVFEEQAIICTKHTCKIELLNGLKR